MMDDSHAHPQNSENSNDLLLNSSPHDWTFGQDFHSFVGVSNTWNLVTVHIEGKQSYSPGMLLFHVSMKFCSSKD